MSTNVAKKNTMKYIHAAIMIMLMLCGGFSLEFYGPVYWGSLHYHLQASLHR